MPTRGASQATAFYHRLVTGTLLLTVVGLKRIEESEPCDVIQTQPNDGSADESHLQDDNAEDDSYWCRRN